MNEARRGTLRCGAALVAAAALCCAPARSQSPRRTPGEEPPEEVRAAWPKAALRGAGTLRAWGLSIADVRLWSEQLFDPPAYGQAPLALELRYHRALSGASIAEQSIVEIERAGPLSDARRRQWHAALRQLLPDVREGDRITGLLLPPGTTRIAYNGGVRGEIADPDFAPRFFGIWLAPQTSEPALRARLLGLGA